MATIQGNDRDALADKEQLAAVRIAVDEVDDQIVTLIARRERLIRIAGTLKGDDAEVRAPGRVERIIEHVRSAAEKKDIDPDIVESTTKKTAEPSAQLLQVLLHGNTGLEFPAVSLAEAGHHMPLAEPIDGRHGKIPGDGVARVGHS
jgi:isochorismate pyruvate lyase